MTMLQALALGLGVVQAYVLFAALFTYYPVLGVLLDKLRPLEDESTPAAPPPRIAVLIAAHDEEAVIGGTVTALMQQRFPLGGFDVFVVADNCRDATAPIARRAGATVYERFSKGPSTKGRALAWMWQHVRGFGYGAVVIMDADNQADDGFLAAIATELARGYQAVQGMRRTKREDAGAVADLDMITELCTHRIAAAGRQRLGMNGPLMGSGVGFSAALFDELVSSVGDTVVEDCEWLARLAERGARVRWTPRAVIYDEKTARHDAMGRQRDRWVAGRGQVARRHIVPCLEAFLRRGNLDALDMACFLVTPPRSLMLAGLAACLLLALVGVPGAWPAWIWALGLAGFAGYVSLALWLDGAPRTAYARLAKSALHLPRFTARMGLATLKAIAGTNVKWVPTPHGR